MKRIILLALVVLACLAIADYVMTTVFFTVYYPFTNVTITDVTLSANPLYVGASTDIFVTLENSGTLSANASVNVSIFNSSGHLIENISYDPAIIPPFSLLTISKSWSAGANPVGNYRANASGLYEDGVNATNVLSEDFQITAIPTPTPSATTAPGGGSSSSTGGTPRPVNETVPTPTTLPPEITPVSSELKFMKSTVLKELSSGSAAVESFMLKNIGGRSKSIKLKISGIPESWFSFSPAESILLPSEERSINLGISVPKEGLPGDYLMKFEAQDESQRAIEYMVLRVKSPTRGAQFPIVHKTVRLDRLLGATIVTIDVINPTTKTIAYVSITEEILRELRATKEDIVFQDKPAAVSGMPLQLKWNFRELLALERTSATYSVYSLLSEYRPYVYWSVKQVEVASKEIKLSDIVSIREISSSPIGEGGSGNLNAKVFYAGFEPVQFKATLEMPSGLKADPPYIEGTLNPRGITDLNYRIDAAFGSSGTHSATLSVLVAEEYMVQQTGYINVQPASALNIQVVIFLILATILMLLSFFHFMGKKKKEKEHKNTLHIREGYIKQIKSHLKPEREAKDVK